MVALAMDPLGGNSLDFGRPRFGPRIGPTFGQSVEVEKFI